MPKARWIATNEGVESLYFQDCAIPGNETAGPSAPPPVHTDYQLLPTVELSAQALHQSPSPAMNAPVPVHDMSKNTQANEVAIDWQQEYSNKVGQFLENRRAKCQLDHPLADR